MAFYMVYDSSGTAPFPVVAYGVCQSGLEADMADPDEPSHVSVAITRVRFNALTNVNRPDDETVGQTRWEYTPSTDTLDDVALSALSARQEAKSRRRMGALIATARRYLSDDSLLTDAARQNWVDYVQAVLDLPNDPNWPDWSSMTIPAQPAVTNDTVSWFKRVRDFRDDPGARINTVGTKVNAGRLAGGTALDSTITVGGDALDTIRSRASDPIARANVLATKLNAAKLDDGTNIPSGIKIGGGNTLSEVRGWAQDPMARANNLFTKLDLARINNGEVPSGWTVNNRSVGDISDWSEDPITRANAKTTALSLQKLAALPGGNLLPNTQFEHLVGWSWNPDGAVGSETSVDVREGGQNWSGSNYPVVRIAQPGTATSGFFDFISKGANGLWDVPVTEGEYYEASVQLSVHRCEIGLNIRWYDDSGTWFATNGIAQTTGPQSEIDDPNAWPVYRLVGQAPTGAKTAAISVRKFGTLSGSNSFVFIHKPQFSATLSGATERVPFSQGTPPTALIGARLMSKGSNGNGSFARWDNGIQMCWITGLNMGAANNGNGIFSAPKYTAAQISVPYPADFTETPGVSLHAVNSGPVSHRSLNLEWANLGPSAIAYLRAVKNSNDGDTSDVIANITLVGRYT